MFTTSNLVKIVTTNGDPGRTRGEEVTAATVENLVVKEFLSKILVGKFINRIDMLGKLKNQSQILILSRLVKKAYINILKVTPSPCFFAPKMSAITEYGSYQKSHSRRNLSK